MGMVEMGYRYCYWYLCWYWCIREVSAWFRMDAKRPSGFKKNDIESAKVE